MVSLNLCFTYPLDSLQLLLVYAIRCTYVENFQSLQVCNEIWRNPVERVFLVWVKEVCSRVEIRH